MLRIWGVLIVGLGCFFGSCQRGSSQTVQTVKITALMQQYIGTPDHRSPDYLANSNYTPALDKHAILTPRAPRIEYLVISLRQSEFLPYQLQIIRPRIYEYSGWFKIPRFWYRYEESH